VIHEDGKVLEIPPDSIDLFAWALYGDGGFYADVLSPNTGRFLGKSDAECVVEGTVALLAAIEESQAPDLEEKPKGTALSHAGQN
jgi:hypothetical protein